MLSMRFCPFAHRVHLMLDHLQVPHRVFNIHLKQKPDWLTEYSLQGKVPALGLPKESGTPFLTESLIVADYLYAKYGDAAKEPLYPDTPLQTALDRIWIERFASTVGPAFYGAAFVRPMPDDALTKLAAGLEPIEAELKQRGTRFFGGAKRPGMLDLMIWPWFERLAALELMPQSERFVLDAQRYPGLVAWRNAMLDDVKAVQKWNLTPEIHCEFMKSNQTGNPDYDMLLKK